MFLKGIFNVGKCYEVGILDIVESVNCFKFFRR